VHPPPPPLTGANTIPVSQRGNLGNLNSNPKRQSVFYSYQLWC
jgi:hypothetical protein